MAWVEAVVPGYAGPPDVCLWETGRIVCDEQGRVVELDYLDMWGEDDSAWSLPFRCKVCPDGIGEAAEDMQPFSASEFAEALLG